jgi:hypothetical protein
MARRKKIRWTIATARQGLPKLIASAAREPQAVYRRNKLVATVVSPQLGAELQAARQARPTMAEALAELRRICAEEDYELSVPERSNRPASFPGRRR